MFKTDEQKLKDSTRACPKCNGSGSFGTGGKGSWGNSTCNNCGGTGRVPR